MCFEGTNRHKIHHVRPLPIAHPDQDPALEMVATWTLTPTCRWGLPVWWDALQAMWIADPACACPVPRVLNRPVQIWVERAVWQDEKTENHYCLLKPGFKCEACKKYKSHVLHPQCFGTWWHPWKHVGSNVDPTSQTGLGAALFGLRSSNKKKKNKNKNKNKNTTDQIHLEFCSQEQQEEQEQEETPKSNQKLLPSVVPSVTKVTLFPLRCTWCPGGTNTPPPVVGPVTPRNSTVPYCPKHLVDVMCFSSWSVVGFVFFNCFDGSSVNQFSNKLWVVQELFLMICSTVFHMVNDRDSWIFSHGKGGCLKHFWGWMKLL